MKFVDKLTTTPRHHLIQVFRITGAFHYWEGDIMRVNQAAVLLKFLPVALTAVNVAAAFSFTSSCTTSQPGYSYFLYANCTAALLTHAAKQTYDRKGSFLCRRLRFCFFLVN